MTGTLHCHLGESYVHKGDSLSLDVKPANPQGHSILSSIRNCNKFYCNLTFCKLNTYLILTNAYLVLWRQNAATNKNI